MKSSTLILVLIFFFLSCKESVNPKDGITDSNMEFDLKVDLTKISDSLILIPDKNLIGDFNGDEKTDFASIVKNVNNDKIGVLILHDSKNHESFVFGAGREVGQMDDLNWIEVFKTLPQGEIISPTLVDEISGDIIGQDETQNFKLIGNGIYISVEESHGGGIIFWNGNEYKWYHIE